MLPFRYGHYGLVIDSFRHSSRRVFARYLAHIFTNSSLGFIYHNTYSVCGRYVCSHLNLKCMYICVPGLTGVKPMSTVFLNCPTPCY